MKKTRSNKFKTVFPVLLMSIVLTMLTHYAPSSVADTGTGAGTAGVAGEIQSLPGDPTSINGDSLGVSIEPTHSIVDRIRNVPEGSWVVVDLDETVMSETQLLGRDEWHGEYTQRKMRQTGLTFKETADGFNALNMDIKGRSAVRATEPSLPAVISELVARGVFVFAITSRHVELERVTIQKLDSIGVHFQGPALQSLPSANFMSGVEFTGGLDKGQALKQIVSHARTVPSSIVFFDDRMSHVKSMAAAISEMKIPGRTYLYSRIETDFTRRLPPELRLRIADEQLKRFISEGPRSEVMSDAAAVLQLSPADHALVCQSMF